MAKYTLKIFFCYISGLRGSNLPPTILFILAMFIFCFAGKRWNAGSNKVQNRISIQQNRPIVENICDCVLLCCLHMLLYLCMLHFDNSAMALGETAKILRMQCIIIL